MLRVADHWYDTRKLSNELTLIYEPHVHPFLRCNIWHLHGRDKDLLVDTGLGVSSLKNAIADRIDKPVMDWPLLSSTTLKTTRLPPPVSPATLMKEMLSTLAIKHSRYTTCRAIHPAALVYGIRRAAHSSLATPSTMSNFWTSYRDRTSWTTSTP